MSNKIILQVVALLVIATVTKAQRATTFFVDNMYQAEVNPAYIPDSKINIYLGNSLLDVGNNGFTLDQVLDSGSGSQVPTWTLNELAGSRKIKNYNLGGVEATISTFDLGYKISDKLAVSVGHSWRLQSGIGYGQGIVNLATFGNAPFIGQRIDLGTYVDYAAFNEIYLGGAYNFGKITFGGRVKYLSGIENLSTGNSNFSIYTDDEIYELTIAADYQLYNSRVLVYEDIDNFEVDTESYLSFNNFLSKNHGLAIDLGATMQISDQLKVILSASDMGSITWNNTPIIYEVSRDTKLEGIDIVDLVKNGGESINLRDSVYAFFEANEERSEYSTDLSPSVHFGGQLTLDMYTFGMMLGSHSVADDRRITLAFVARKKINDLITLTLSNSVRDGVWINPGLGIEGKYKGIRGFLSSANVISLLAPKSQHVFNLQGGIGYAF